MASEVRLTSHSGRGARRRVIAMALPAVLMCLCIVTLLLPPLLLAPLAGRAAGAVPPDAVRVSASAYPHGPVLAQRTITEPRVAADLYAQLGQLPAFTGWMGCTLGPPYPISYTLRFTRWGAPVTVATLGFGDCAAPRRWNISSGGYNYSRLDASGATTRAAGGGRAATAPAARLSARVSAARDGAASADCR